jgi:hypothetical protein
MRRSLARGRAAVDGTLSIMVGGSEAVFALSLLKNVVGVGIGLQLIAPEFMGRSEYIADVHDRQDINGIFRHGQRA